MVASARVGDILEIMEGRRRVVLDSVASWLREDGKGRRYRVSARGFLMGEGMLLRLGFPRAAAYCESYKDLVASGGVSSGSLGLCWLLRALRNSQI